MKTWDTGFALRNTQIATDFLPGALWAIERENRDIHKIISFLDCRRL